MVDNWAYDCRSIVTDALYERFQPEFIGWIKNGNEPSLTSLTVRIQKNNDFSSRFLGPGQFSSTEFVRNKKKDYLIKPWRIFFLMILTKPPNLLTYSSNWPFSSSEISFIEKRKRKPLWLLSSTNKTSSKISGGLRFTTEWTVRSKGDHASSVKIITTEVCFQFYLLLQKTDLWQTF